jgi:hypothetical protein
MNGASRLYPAGVAILIVARRATEVPRLCKFASSSRRTYLRLSACRCVRAGLTISHNNFAIAI